MDIKHQAVFYQENINQGDILRGMPGSLPVKGSFIWAIVEKPDGIVSATNDTLIGLLNTKQCSTRKTLIRETYCRVCLDPYL